MRLKPRTLFSFSLFAVFIAAANGQLAIENRALSVPQQCAMYLSEEPVLKKLALTDAQVQTYTQLVKGYIAESEKLDQLKTAKDSDRTACDIKFANACLAVLNSVQKHTLLQIGVPRIGTVALIDPAVSEEVGLEAGQVTKIKALCEDVAKKDEDVSEMIANAIDQIPVPKPGADRKAYDKKCVQVAAAYNGERQRVAREKAEADKKTLDLLTPTQKTKWLELAGSEKKK